MDNYTRRASEAKLRVFHQNFISAATMISPEGPAWRRKAASDVASDFLDRTTAHGVGNWKRTYSSNSKIRLFFWIVATAAAFFGFFYQASLLFIEFYSYPYSVDISFYYGQDVHFPTVSVCNMNPAALSKVVAEYPTNKDVQSLVNTNFGANILFRSELFHRGSGKSSGGGGSKRKRREAVRAKLSKNARRKRALFKPPFESTTELWDSSQKTDVSTLDFNETGIYTTEVGGSQQTVGVTINSIQSGQQHVSMGHYWQQQNASNYYGKMPEDMKTKEIFNQMYSNFAEETKMSIGHDLSDMLVSCMFGGMQCSPENFTRFYNYKYGTCYKFNGHTDENLILKSSRPGPLYGLTLELNVQQNEYIGGLTHEAGFRVLIQSQKLVPFPEDEGFTISPGFSTSVGVRLVNITRLEHPYRSNCTWGKPTLYWDNRTNLQEPVYSVQGCMKSCAQERVISLCNCASAAYPIPNGVRICDQAQNETDATCVSTAFQEVVNQTLSCDCPQACHDRAYVKTISSSVWPSEMYLESKLKGLKNMGEEFEDFDDSKLGRNLAKLEVYFQELNYENIEEKGSYNEENLIGDIGGLAGFYIGISVCTVGEVLELLFDLFLCLLAKCYRPCNGGEMEDSNQGKAKNANNDDQWYQQNKPTPFFIPRVQYTGRRRSIHDTDK